MQMKQESSLETTPWRKWHQAFNVDKQLVPSLRNSNQFALFATIDNDEIALTWPMVSGYRIDVGQEGTILRLEIALDTKSQVADIVTFFMMVEKIKVEFGTDDPDVNVASMTLSANNGIIANLEHKNAVGSPLPFLSVELSLIFGKIELRAPIASQQKGLVRRG